MRFALDDKGPESAMDMTPMIDCVFQLIIFFMLITDMGQKEREEIHLPYCRGVADADLPRPHEVRPIVNILSDGSMWVKRQCYFDPKHDDNYRKLAEYLAHAAEAMPQEAIDANNPAGPPLSNRPKNPLLIRADSTTPAKYVQKVMEVCGRVGIPIWKVELVVLVDDTDDTKREKPVTTIGGK